MKMCWKRGWRYSQVGIYPYLYLVRSKGIDCADWLLGACLACVQGLLGASLLPPLICLVLFSGTRQHQWQDLLPGSEEDKV